MADVFISYAREDVSVAEALAHALQDQGWTVWWDRDLIAGRDFEEAIEAELRMARACVVLFSPTAARSRWVRSEASVAAELGTLVPVLLDGAQPPLPFRTIHAVELCRDELLPAQGSPASHAVGWIHAAVASLPAHLPTPDRALARTAASATAGSGSALSAGSAPPAGSAASQGSGVSAGLAPQPAVGQPSVGPAPAAAPATPPHRRSRGMIAVLVAAVVALAAGVAALASSRGDSPARPGSASTATSSPGGVASTGHPPDGRLFLGVSDPANVRSLQRLLDGAGYDVNPDGKFGDATEKALRRFELKNASKRGVTVDGTIIVGGTEWRLLQQGQGGSDPSALIVPEVVGLSTDAARAQLLKQGFHVAVKTHPDAQEREGRVIETQPRAGSAVSPGETVTLVVSSAAPPALPAPALIAPSNGTPQLAAISILLVWAPVAGADYYVVEVLSYRAPDVRPTTTKQEADTTTHLLEPDGAVKVEWRVLAKSWTGRTSPGSQWWTILFH